MVWDVFIATYLFLAGLGAGAFTLGVLAGWSKNPAPGMQKVGVILGPVAVAAGTLLLVFDAHAGLMNPARFFLLISNMSSVMAWGVIILSLFIVVTAADAVILFVKNSTIKALDAAGVVLAFCVAVYTGVLLGDASIAFPLWHPLVLPVLFAASAASTGFAAVLLISHFIAKGEQDNLPFLRKTELILPASEALLIIALLGAAIITTGSGAAAAKASVSALLTGDFAITFWVGLVIVGLAVPATLDLMHMKKLANNPATADGNVKTTTASALPTIANACVLIGGFFLRYLIIMAAVPLPFG